LECWLYQQLAEHLEKQQAFIVTAASEASKAVGYLQGLKVI
jgi:hypothetical protein